MPPFVSRKRQHSPEPSPSAKRQALSKSASKRSKQSLFDAIDSPDRPVKSAEETDRYLKTLDDEDEAGSSLSQVDSDEFEDVPTTSKPHAAAPVKDEDQDEDEDEDDDEDGDEDEMEWEDAIGEGPSTATAPEEPEIGDVSITLKEDGSYVEPLVSLATGKKAPSKKERRARFLTHCLHVQSLMWHNTMRNSWLNDGEVQQTLVEGLTDGVKREITRWREAMGTLSQEELDAKKKQAAAKNKGKRGRKGKDKSSGRDWNYDAQHSEQGVPNLSGGDPLLRLLKVLAAYWRKKFTVTAPAFRKLGYMPLKRLREEIKGWQNDRDNAEEHGERIEDVAEFRKLAKKCEGSRDVGGQLFVALLRGIGLDTRMVANLQPAGIGWSKAEEADPKKSKKDQKVEKEEEKVKGQLEPVEESKSAAKKRAASRSQKKLKEEKPKRTSTRGNKGQPINLDESDSPLSELSSGAEIVGEAEDDGDISVIDVTPSSATKKSTKKYDRDLAFPTYWTEVCSPATHKFIPIDPIVLSTIASNDELLQTFEPRGKKAEYAKQVVCYTIAFSSDGTAKDVTVRYLKKHQLPGKTKGMRLPAERIPIYNNRGKVKKYEDYDWFRTVMSLYDRPDAKRTPADDLEEQTDLKPFKPVKEDKEAEKESLQWYKQSAEFVLGQHLRREEAIVPGATPVKTFTAGKGDKAKDHPVYRREDVATCKTVESWHKEGRAVKFGEQPIKHVPMRAVTLVRKREMEEAFRETGEKLTQGLYSWDQTDWIIPPPIENGVIPKNAFGNMDVYVETMVPKGAVHLPLKGTAKICRKLEIDYAEACTGFEFGKQRAVPVLTGVVVAEENAKLVRDAWGEEQKEIKRKEDTKRTAAALHWWRKMLMGMRIVERMRAEYANDGAGEDEVNPFVSKAQREGRETMPMAGDAGGFFAPGHEEEEVPQARNHQSKAGMGGGFLNDDDEENNDQDHEEAQSPEGIGGGGFVVEDDPDHPAAPQQKNGNRALTKPVSLQSMHQVRTQQGEDESMGEEDDVGEEQELTQAAKRLAAKKLKSKGKKPPANSKGNPKLNRRASVPTLPDDASDSPLSELDDHENDEEMSDSEVALKSNKPASPRVMITPRNATSRRTRITRPAKKATPTRSQYFANADDDEEDDDDESEEEVVKPTRTTARTRKRG
ncbi:DNA repair rhp42 [Lecanosticta acicola]|uniref:DNA repair rhp42 n=1 Tax=Lecanosticta acicola TaxID=111012 RepID=A0AAI8YZK7_9PEZI|nr:DNA repair rhp42 [Lecanosticta acicola]